MKKRQVVVKTDQEGGRRSGGESRVVICYEDCLKNHAVSIRGYAVDGCKEFMASGAEGTANALICAVCRCHRNFHRKKEIAAEANPTYEKYLKKKIDTYDEMATVVGKDVARGSGAKSLDDVEIQSHGTTNLEEKGEGELVKENDKQSTSSAQLESRKSQNHNDDSEFQNISTQMAEVAAALQKISKSKLDVDFLYQEVMKTEGFQEDFLGSALDHLVEHKNLAKGFLAKSDKLRRIWLEKFKENN